MSEEVPFVDILEPIKTQCGILSMMSRTWKPQRTYVKNKCYSPQDIKDLVSTSVYLDSVIEVESARTGVRKEELQQQVLDFLEEMGYDKKLYIIRWMGVVFLKICFMMRVGVFVNEPAILKLRSNMGQNPVLFLPTHRSYADFCLMTYLSYNYDIDFPAVAAGMDFYSMAVVGKSMRETCAFYIRRTLAGAPLYAATLRQYVRTLVANHSAPIEFFLEGTRSRSNKSLPPKYGMLSMALVPYFAREVSDVTIVPVNISYDRLMETSLFAYEHLGVPKPKESTGGFLKALSSLNDHYGNIYINFGTAFSVREYLPANHNSAETLKPVDLQQLTPEQFTQVQDIANYVITLQQESTVATITNLVALVLMQSLIRNVPLDFEETLAETEWVIKVLRSLGASVFEKDVRSSVERILVVHSKMVRLDRHRRLRLVASALINVSLEVKNKMKGHILQGSTMVNAVPIIQLQLYINPVLHYLTPPALVYLLVRTPLTREQLVEDYRHIRKLLRHEIFHIEKNEDATFHQAVVYCLENDIIEEREDLLCSGRNSREQYLLQCGPWPALNTLIHCADVITEQETCSHEKAMALVQALAERSSNCHPYCLSLDCIANCLTGLVLAGAVEKVKGQSEVVYSVVPGAMSRSRAVMVRAAPSFVVDFKENSVLVSQATVPAKL